MNGSYDEDSQTLSHDGESTDSRYLESFGRNSQNESFENTIYALYFLWVIASDKRQNHEKADN